MTWNHRIVDCSDPASGEVWFEVCECYYDEAGQIEGHSSACLGSESPEGLIEVLQRMIDDIKRNPAIVRMEGGA